MATYNDLTTVVNSVVEQALGKDAITTFSMDNFASLGEKVVDSSNSKSLDVVFGKLLDRIGKTVVDVRGYKGRFGYMFRSAFEYGCILQKIHIDNFEAKTSAVYDDLSNGDVDGELFKIFLPSVTQTLYENEKPWEFAVTLTPKQLKSAFTSPETLTAFINGIYVAMANSIEKYIETMSRIAVETLIAHFISAQEEADADSETANFAINVLQKYYDETGKDLTGKWKYDADFYRWLCGEFADYKKLLSEMTVLFNLAGYERHTSDEYLAFLINSKVADNIKRYMESDVYNDEFVKAPVYEEVSYWQGLGESASLDDRLTIKGTYTDGEDTVSLNHKVIAVMHDTDAIGVTVKERDTVVIPNDHKHTKNLFEQGMVGHFVDTTQNTIVFYIGSVTTTGAGGGTGAGGDGAGGTGENL